MKIFLIGLPGSGKTTVGKALAALLHKKFIDLDDEIEKKEGCLIKDIFQSKGEEYFRKIERDALREATTSIESFVMSTGGGAPVYHDNMAFMNDNGVTIFINPPLEVIASRLSKSNIEERPLFAGSENVIDKLNELHTSRISVYQRAHHIVADATANDLASLLSRD